MNPQLPMTRPGVSSCYYCNTSAAPDYCLCPLMINNATPAPMPIQPQMQSTPVPGTERLNVSVIQAASTQSTEQSILYRCLTDTSREGVRNIAIVSEDKRFKDADTQTSLADIGGMVACTGEANQLKDHYKFVSSMGAYLNRNPGFFEFQHMLEAYYKKANQVPVQFEMWDLDQH
jgi:hypothetical protein